MNSKKLYTKKPKRLFTFGCSFTNYMWTTWADILGYELDCEYYNYGQSGAGNQYIFNSIMQTDCLHNFNDDDLVIVEWTSATRNDLFKNNKWSTPGNVYNQEDYDKNSVDVNYYSLRDFASIKATMHFLETKTQYHFLSMVDLNTTFNQFTKSFFRTDKTFTKIKNLYSDVLDNINPSFYDVLWQNKIQNKRIKNEKVYQCHFWDLHPDPIEHLEYLQHIFDYEFSDRTVNKIIELNTYLVDTINKFAEERNLLIPNADFEETQLTQELAFHIEDETKLDISQKIDYSKLVLQDR